MSSLDKQEQRQHRSVNYFRTAHSSETRLLLAEVIVRIAKAEHRERQRRADDQAHFYRLVESVICDTAYHHILQPEGRLFVSLNRTTKAWRYRPRWVSGKVLPGLLYLLDDLKIVELTKTKPQEQPKMKGCYIEPSSIKAGEVLLALMQEHGAVNLSDFTCHYDGDEIVILKSEKQKTVDEAGNEIDRPNELVDYADDNAEANARRAEMRSVNAGIQGLNIGLRDRHTLPPSAKLPHGTIIDVNERHLKRYYTCGDNGLQHGGRLFNRPLPFWMWMKKVQRKALLTLNGEQVIELDFNGMNPRLLYGLAGATLPSELEADPYAIPGFERSRAGIKKMFSAMLFGANLPAWTIFPEEIEANKGAFFHPEEQCRGQDAIEAIRTAHHPVKHLFGTRIGHRLQNMESNILVSILLELQGLNIPALPVHDCVIVPRSQKEQVKAVMARVFKEITGTDGRVSEG